MSNTESPLSPHLSIYRWPITMVISILHRVTGAGLSLGLLVFTWWLFAVAMGGADYERFAEVAASLPGRVCLFAWTYAFFLHFANGIRHLVWDFGYGFEKRQANASGWFVLILALVLSVAFWVVL